MLLWYICWSIKGCDMLKCADFVYCDYLFSFCCLMPETHWVWSGMCKIKFFPCWTMCSHFHLAWSSKLFLLSPLQMVRCVRSAGIASSIRHGTWVSVTWRPSGSCRLLLSCETSPLRRPMSSCWRPTERACASFCSVPTVTSSHSDSLDWTRWATWLLRWVWVLLFLGILFRWVKTVVQCQNIWPNMTSMTLQLMLWIWVSSVK